MGEKCKKCGSQIPAGMISCMMCESPIEKTYKMNLKCIIGIHKWIGCKCDRCGKERNNEVQLVPPPDETDLFVGTWVEEIPHLARSRWLVYTIQKCDGTYTSRSVTEPRVILGRVYST
jgi:hypothetical protein